MLKIDVENITLQGSLQMKRFNKTQYNEPVKYALHWIETVSGEWDVANKTLQGTLSLYMGNRGCGHRVHQGPRGHEIYKFKGTVTFKGHTGDVGNGVWGLKNTENLDLDDTRKLQEIDGSNAHKTHNTKNAHPHDYHLLHRTHLLLVQPAIKAHASKHVIIESSNVPLEYGVQ